MTLTVEGVTRETSTDLPYRRTVQDMVKHAAETFHVVEKCVFTVSTKGLFDIYLKNLDASIQQEHNCNTCRHFFHLYGGLVWVDGYGVSKSIAWGVEPYHPYSKAFKALKEEVERRQILTPFVAPSKFLGRPTDGGFEHFYLEVPKHLVHTDALKTPEQLEAEYVQSHQTLTRALGEYSIDVLRNALKLLKSESLSRSEQFVGWVEWLIKQRLVMSNLAYNAMMRKNILWGAVVTSPAGWCSPRSSSVGQLIDWLTQNMDIVAIKHKWDEMLDPVKYLRPQAAPKDGAIDRAEKIFETLGAASALDRRYAMHDEIRAQGRLLWTPRDIIENKSTKHGLFGDLRKSAPAIEQIEAPAVKMSYARFERKVLPNAAKIQLRITSGNMNFTQFLTAVHDDALPIFQWDNYQNRNPFSSYFHRNGSTAREFNLTPSTWVDVMLITLHPKYWASGTYEDGIALLLKDCKDTSNEGGNAIFPETLKSQFHEVRSVVEAKSRMMKIQGFEQSSAAGVGFRSGNGELHLRVTEEDGMFNRYIIDRLD